MYTCMHVSACVGRSQWYWSITSALLVNFKCTIQCSELAPTHFVVRSPELNPFCFYLIETESPCGPGWPQSPPNNLNGWT